MPAATLSRPLVDILETYCRDHSAECPLGECVTAEPLSLRRALTLTADDGGKRLVRDNRCQNCTVVLLLQAMERNIGHEKMAEWLDKPLIDLRGRTPRQCLDSNDQDSVINALWLLDDHELTCG